MNLSLSAVLFALASFAVTFVVARILGKRWRARRSAKEEQKLLAGQSRQVRRAKQRKNSAR